MKWTSLFCQPWKHLDHLTIIALYSSVAVAEKSKQEPRYSLRWALRSYVFRMSSKNGRLKLESVFPSLPLVSHRTCTTVFFGRIDSINPRINLLPMISVIKFFVRIAIGFFFINLRRLNAFLRVLGLTGARRKRCNWCSTINNHSDFQVIYFVVPSGNVFDSFPCFTGGNNSVPKTLKHVLLKAQHKLY